MNTELMSKQKNNNTELLERIQQLQQLDLIISEYTEYKNHDIESDIDPDNNLLSSDINCNYYSTDHCNSNLIIKGKFSIIHFNSRSMYTNYNEIQDYLQTFKYPFSVIAISETWFNENKGINFEMEDYDLTYTNRQNKMGGGVALYVHKTIKYSILQSMSIAVDNVMECLTIEIINEKKKNIIISCVYRSPGSSINIFNEWVEKLFSAVNDKPLFICGDYNIDLLNPNNHKPTSEFIDLMYGMSFFPLITKPSRITSHCATLIDNIFTNNISNNTVNGLLICDITDHLPVFTIYDYNVCKSKATNNVSYRRLRTADRINAFNEDLRAYNWNSICGEMDIERAYNKFLEIFTLLYNKHCPIRVYQNNKKYVNRPWISKGLQKACKKKNNLYKSFLKLKTKEAENRYKLYKNKLTAAIRSAKKLYYKKLLFDNKSNIRRTWEILNNLIKQGSKKHIYPDYFVDSNGENHNINRIVNDFNHFFVNVGPELASKIPNHDSEPNFERNTNTIFLTAVTEDEILKIVQRFKNKFSTDCQQIDIALVKQVINNILTPLTHVCNLSLKYGYVPRKMKIAKVIPLFKNGNIHHYTNYRPISLLPQFSKILEKIFDVRLQKFIDKYKLINEGQYGFRSNRSTSMAIVDATEEISKALDNKRYAIGIFIDLQKAFDTINHEILLKKLERYGLRGVAGKWVKSYLSDRVQYVQMGEYSSKCLDIACGVPQGSVLGPKLFNLYINDIFNVSQLVKCILFADDTNIFYSNDSFDQLINTVNTELSKIKKWMESNKLSLNINKTKLMLFGNYQSKSQKLVDLDGVNIENVPEIKFLGLMIDNKLSWKTHIRHITTKVSKSLAIMNRVKHVLDYHALHTLYCSLILPYLTYCVEVWGNNYKTSIQSLFHLQKKVIRIIHKAGYLDHTNPLFLKSKLLKMYDLVNLYTAQIMFRAFHNLLPVNIQNIFSHRGQCYSLRGFGNFIVPMVRTTRRSFSVSVCGVKLWNSLGLELKQCQSIYYFKSLYKSNVWLKYRDMEV